MMRYVGLTLALAVCQVSAMVMMGGGVGGAPGNMPGGLTHADSNSAGTQEMALFAVGELGPNYALSSVLNTQTQVVAGTMTHLSLAVVKTINGVGKTMTCDVKVHEMSWLPVPYKEVTEHCCFLDQNL